MALTGPTVPVWRCPLFGVDRKWLADAQNGAFDPERTLALAAVWVSMLILEPVYSDLGLSSGKGLRN
jgi:hypothetical protein